MDTYPVIDMLISCNLMQGRGYQADSQEEGKQEVEIWIMDKSNVPLGKITHYDQKTQ
jgi:hypothetical protein